MIKLHNNEESYNALVSFNEYLEINNLLHASYYIAVKRPINKIWGILFTPIIGLPTHHSKYVAFQTPASPIM